MELAADGGVVPAVQAGDELLWRRCLAGDGEAFGLLFDRHRDRVFRHACRLVDARSDAEDVAAATFLELWRRRADVRLVEASVLPWLLVTATNVGRNSARGTRRYRTFLERLPRAQEEPDVAETALRSSLGMDAGLASALRSLSTQDAALFVLVALEGYTASAAAEQLGLSVPATRTRLHRARARLRTQLESSNSEVRPAKGNR
jgi:RNA polymerase sigma-70 factor (ECF subfamily)